MSLEVHQISDKSIEIRVDAYTTYRLMGPYDVYSLTCIAHEKPESERWYEYFVRKGLSFFRKENA